MAVVASTKQTRVLIADDEEHQRNGLATMLRGWGYATETAADGQAALEKLAAQPADALITDLMMPGIDGFELLRRLSAQGMMLPTIVLTAFGGIDKAVSAVHDLGAFWFMEKPIQPPVLRALLARAVSQNQMAQETERLQRQLSYDGRIGDLVGSTQPMQEVFSLIRQVAPSNAAVLVTGESGTGKELVARAVHQLSPRRGGPFVALNCAAMPETLMESELFGHEKGAFTGAVERRAGCFELAQNGTLLLDEIGDMPHSTQAKLLRVLEDSRVRRLGGNKETTVNVRVIASTNKNLDDALRKSEFREDLYFRLNVFHIGLPPLRERPEDLPALVETLLHDLNKKHSCRIDGVDPEVLDLFRQHSWPGNVRELRNVLERAVILAGEGMITSKNLPNNLGNALGLSPRPTVEPGAVRLPVGTTISEAEKAMILKTLEHTGNNKTRAAAILGISQKTMFNKLKEYGADTRSDAPDEA